MTQRTHELLIPQQYKPESEPPALEVGDWAYVTRCLQKRMLIDPEQPRSGRKDYWSIETFRGIITQTPQSTMRDMVEVRKVGLPTQLPMMSAFKLAEVRLLDRDNEFLYEPYSDLMISPDDTRYHLEHFDLAAKLQHAEADVIDLR